jgi:hypothetical protein
MVKPRMHLIIVFETVQDSYLCKRTKHIAKGCVIYLISLHIILLQITSAPHSAGYNYSSYEILIMSDHIQIKILFIDKIIRNYWINQIYTTHDSTSKLYIVQEQTQNTKKIGFFFIFHYSPYTNIKISNRNNQVVISRISCPRTTIRWPHLHRIGPAHNKNKKKIWLEFIINLKKQWWLKTSAITK